MRFIPLGGSRCHHVCGSCVGASRSNSRPALAHLTKAQWLKDEVDPKSTELRVCTAVCWLAHWLASSAARWWVVWRTDVR